MACCRALGKMAGYHKQKRLHKSIDEARRKKEQLLEDG